MKPLPYFWLGWDQTGPSSIGFNFSPISGDLRQVVAFDASGNDLGLGSITVQDGAMHRINDVQFGGFNLPYHVYLLAPGDSCSDYNDCATRYQEYQTIYATQQASHCDFQYQTVAGSLDSYPVVQSSNCYNFVPGQTTGTCGSSTSSPCYTHTDYGDVVLVLLVMLCIMFIGGISFLSSATKRKMTAKLE